jgi:hypothetical protein
VRTVSRITGAKHCSIAIETYRISDGQLFLQPSVHETEHWPVLLSIYIHLVAIKTNHLLFVLVYFSYEGIAQIICLRPFDNQPK